MDGVDMDLYALVANKILAERIAANNAARVAASSIPVPRAPSAVDVQQKRASGEVFLAPGDLGKSANIGKMIAGAPGWLAGKIGPYVHDLMASAGATAGRAQNAARGFKKTVDKGLGQFSGMLEHGQRKMDEAFVNAANPISAAPGTPEHAAAVRRNAAEVFKAKRARKMQLKQKPARGARPAGPEAASLSDRARELLGAGAMLGYQMTGDGEEKTSTGAGRRARRLGRRNARTLAGERKVPGAMPPPEEVAAAQAQFKARGEAMKAQRAAGAAAGVAQKPQFNTPGPKSRLPRGVKPGPSPVPPSGSLGGAASAGAAGAAGASPAPGDLSQHLKSVYGMTGSQWMSRGTKRLGALGSYMAQHHPLASAGVAGLGGLAAMYGARRLYRDFLGGGDQERPKITIGM